ncbi:signal recognition particle-docking protein FtsY [candidate division KSB1 bacterium]|nr:signal recognition particle-docking protein FtsY [candidate division KSB1 bacterium]
MLEFMKLKKGLTKTRESLVGKISKIIKSRKKIDDDLLDEIEEILIGADVGVDVTLEIVDELKNEIKKQGYQNSGDVLNVLKQSIIQLLCEAEPDQGTETQSVPAPSLRTSGDGHKPHVVMVVGVNGTGKTTTIGKLANHYKSQNKRVLLAAADTFRAAAAEQLAVWADRAGVELIRNQAGADPAAVAYDSLNAALARDIDILIVDTAGRLHTKINLMEEVKKIKRVMNKQIPTAPHEILLVLDATTGQNGLNQARQFLDALGVTGLVLTKLDGTAKGGIVISIRRQLNLPVRYIGVGEGIDDLEYFDPRQFAEALFQ